jgi:hypothetical protein
MGVMFDFNIETKKAKKIGATKYMYFFRVQIQGGCGARGEESLP